MQERRMAGKAITLLVVLTWALTSCAAPPTSPTAAPAPTTAPAVATTAPVAAPTETTAPTATTAPTETSQPTETAMPPAPTTSPAMAGAAIYHFSCQVCHGPDAAGGIKVGGTVSADLRWKTLGPTYKNDTKLLTTSIENSVDETGKPLDPAMPKWKGVLSDTQVSDVIAFLQTGPAQPVTSTETLTATQTLTSTAPLSPTTEGKALYDLSCQECHRPTGAGGVKVGGTVSADLRWPTLGPTYKNDTKLLMTSIENSVDETGKPLDPAMPKWKGTLTDDQVNAIIAYLQTLK